MAWRVVNAQHAFDHAVSKGAVAYLGADKTMDVPAIEGIGGSLIYFVENYYETNPYNKEFDWVGKRLRIGGAEFDINERITRCLATTANPATGLRDADTLGALQDNWGHKQFGVYGVVVKSGQINLGDEIEVL